MASDARTRYQRQIREVDMQRTITECVEHLGGRVWSVRDSRGMGVEDMPDLVIVCGRTVMLLELKSQYRVVTPGQDHVLNLLTHCDRLVSGIVRPLPKEGELSIDDVLAIVKGERAA